MAVYDLGLIMKKIVLPTISAMAIPREKIAMYLLVPCPFLHFAKRTNSKVISIDPGIINTCIKPINSGIETKLLEQLLV